MPSSEVPPVACTLPFGEFQDRLAWVATLTRESLRGHERRDLVLRLRYAPDAIERVREFVRREEACCAFLSFELREAPDETILTITAPEHARLAADQLFDHFTGSVESAPPSRSPSNSCGG